MKKLSWTTFFCTTLAIAGGAYLASCGGSSSISGSSTAANYSADTVVASPFVATSTTTSKILTGRELFATTLAERREELQEILSCTALEDAQFAIDLQSGAGRAECYGPNLKYTNHASDDSAGCLPTGDLGIWNATNDVWNGSEITASTEACTAAQVNELMNTHAGKSHLANLIGGRMLCLTNVTSDLSLPSAGDTTTFDETQLSSLSFGTAVEAGETPTEDFLSVTSASITGVDHSDSGNTLYRYEATGVLGDLDQSESVGFRVVAQHVQTSDGFKARLSYVFNTTGELLNCGEGSGPITDAGTQTINKNSESELVIELDHGTFCGNTDPLNSSYQVDPSDKYNSGSNPNGWANNWNYALFRFDPRSDEATYLNGDYVYAWQAGSGDGWTRVFNATIASEDSDQIGTGYFGFGPDVSEDSERSTDLGKIRGMICNWAGPGNTKTASDYVQRQSIKRNSSTGTWEVNAAATQDITYVPQNDCGDTPVGDFTYGAGRLTSPPNTCSEDLNFDLDSDEDGGTLDLFDISGSKSGDYYVPFSSFPSRPTL